MESMPPLRHVDPSEREELGVRVSHELKNALSAVKALVQLGLRNPLERQSHERLAVLEREVTRMQEIMQSHLSSRRALEEMVPARVRLGALVSETLLVLSTRADAAHVRLSSHGDGLVKADPRRLKEALLWSRTASRPPRPAERWS